MTLAIKVLLNVNTTNHHYRCYAKTFTFCKQPSIGTRMRWSCYDLMELCYIFEKRVSFILCFRVGYQEISVKIFFNLTLVPPVKIPIFIFLLPRLIARASQPDANMMSFTLNFSRLT